MSGRRGVHPPRQWLYDADNGRIARRLLAAPTRPLAVRGRPFLRLWDMRTRRRAGKRGKSWRRGRRGRA